jgi:flagellar biosynthesis/type III secretory pathway chaperone
MSHDLIEETIAALDSLLDDERKALLSGQLDRIAQLHDRKSELIDALNALDRKEQEKVEQLSDKVTRNQELLNAAMEGIRSVAQRLAAVRQVREQLETYDAEGRKTSIRTQQDSSLEKRA